MTGGTVNAVRSLIRSDGSNARGEYNLSGSAVYNNSQYSCVGTAGGSFGTLRMRDNAQVLVSTDFNVSDQANSTGTMYLDGGLARGQNVFIGKSANTTATVVQTGGQLLADGDLYIAWDAASTGNVTLTGGQITVNGGVLRVGNAGTATLNQTGGGVSTANWLVVGQGGNKTSTYNISGGTLDVNTNGGDEKLQVGVWDTVDARFNVSGDARVTVYGGGGESGGLQVGGDHTGARGTMTLADTASVTAPWLTVGFTGPGTLTQTGGTLSISGNPQIGRAALGTYNQSGGTFNWGGWYAVGRLAGGNGTYNLSGTGAAVGNNMIVAEAGGTIGTMTVADSASLTLNRLEVARAGTATLTQTGGQVRSGVVNIANASGTGSYSLQGGLLETPALTRGAGTPAFSFTGGTLHANFVGFSLVNDGGTVDVGPIDGRMVRVWYDGNAPTDTNPPENWNFALAVPWDVDSDTDTDWGGGDAPPLGYPGGSADYYSVVYLGQVYVPAAGNVAFREQVDDATALFVDGTRVLWDFEDTGIIDGSAGNPWETHTQNAVALTQGWHDLEIRLGDHWGGQGGVLQWDPAGGSNWQAIGAGSLRTPAQTVVLGDYTQTAAGALALDIDAATGAAEKLAVVGTLSADGDLELGLPSGLPDYYEVFDILDFAAANGQFNLISDPAYPLPPAAYWDTSLLYQTGEIWLAVPEPATWLLAGFSALLLGAAALARNRKRR